MGGAAGGGFTPGPWLGFWRALLREGGPFAFFMFVVTVLLIALLWANLDAWMKGGILTVLVVLAFWSGAWLILRRRLSNEDRRLLGLLRQLETGQVPPKPNYYLSQPLRKRKVSQRRLLDFFNRLDR